MLCVFVMAKELKYLRKKMETPVKQFHKQGEQMIGAVKLSRLNFYYHVHIRQYSPSR